MTEHVDKINIEHTSREILLTKSVWLTWHDHPRSRNLAQRLNAEIRIYSRRMSGSLRHIEGTVSTIIWLLRDHPRVIFLQNSFLLLIVVALYRRINPKHVEFVVADCHNKSLKRRIKGPLATIFMRLKQFGFSCVDLAIVSNTLLLEEALQLVECALPLIDPLPNVPAADPPVTVDKRFDRYVLFVCSHEPDEPSQIIFEACCGLIDDNDFAVVVTGRVPVGNPIEHLAGRMGAFLPGYVSDEEYRALLHHANVVVVLTEDSDCLCCGAYEAVSCRRKTVLAHHPLARSVFGESVSYTSLDSEELESTVRDLIDQKTDTVHSDGAVRTLRKRFDQEFAELLIAILSRCSSTIPPNGDISSRSHKD